MSMKYPAQQPGRSGRQVPRWVTRLLVATALSILFSVLAVGMVLWYFAAGLPSFGSLADYHPPQVTRMVDRQGKIVAELFDEKRTVVSLLRIPGHVRNAFLAAEDADFYQHRGMDFAGLLRAAWRNLWAGRVVEGGSTITQQVIKTFILGPERSYSRKIRELLLSLRLESNLTKDEILSLYLNQIFFGHQCHGIEEASRFYFGKDVADLTLAEGAMLASLPKSPARYSPLKHPQRALDRRNWVLDQMVRHKMATLAEAEHAKKEPILLAAGAPDFLEMAPYYVEHCRRWLEERLGRDLLYKGGLRIELALDAEMNRIAQRAVEEGLRQVDQRQGFRGPLGHLSADELQGLQQKPPEVENTGQIWTLEEANTAESETKAGARWRVRWQPPRDGLRVVVPVLAVEGTGKAAVARLDLGSTQASLDLAHAKWARKFSPVDWTPPPSSVSELMVAGDLVEVSIAHWQKDHAVVDLSQPPLVQGSLLAIDPTDRHVLAVVGGSDFRRTPLIRAVQSKRPPGSAFKPVVYAAAIHTKAYTPATILVDSPEVYYSGLPGSIWKPQNFERTFVGPVSLRRALAHSINTIAVKVSSDIGPEAIIAMARSLGIQSELGNNLSLALGTSEVTLLELVNTYATFDAHGIAAPPVFVTAVTKASGERIELPVTEQRQAVSAAEAYVVTSLLKDVIEEGTGKRATTLGRPMAGKTGTASEHRDGWFVGYSPDLVAGVWVGFDDDSPIGTSWAQGAGTALPIWIAFMEKALQGQPRDEFQAPDGVVFVRVDPVNGLLAPAGSADGVFETFVEGTEPRSFSTRPASEVAGSGAENSSVPATGSDGRLPEGLFH